MVVHAEPAALIDVMNLTSQDCTRELVVQLCQRIMKLPLGVNIEDDKSIVLYFFNATTTNPWARPEQRRLCGSNFHRSLSSPHTDYIERVYIDTPFRKPSASVNNDFNWKLLERNCCLLKRIWPGFKLIQMRAAHEPGFKRCQRALEWPSQAWINKNVCVEALTWMTLWIGFTVLDLFSATTDRNNNDYDK